MYWSQQGVDEQETKLYTCTAQANWSSRKVNTSSFNFSTFSPPSAFSISPSSLFLLLSLLAFYSLSPLLFSSSALLILFLSHLLPFPPLFSSSLSSFPPPPHILIHPIFPPLLVSFQHPYFVPLLAHTLRIGGFIGQPVIDGPCHGNST